MWAVRDLTTQTVMLDFSSSGQADHPVTQIVIDGAMFANAAELSSWDDTRVQVHICEHCGVEHCASGGWLVVRNVGVGAAFIPAFDEMLAGDWERAEYAPPYFAQGMPLFAPTDYAKLRHWCVGLPPLEALPELTGDELLRCLQWEVPARVLGMFPADVQLDWDLLLAVSEGEVSVAATLLDSAIRHAHDASRASLIPSPSTSRAITLYLNACGTPEWTALYVNNDQTRLAAPIPHYFVEAN
jgi:hypothetical protein